MSIFYNIRYYHRFNCYYFANPGINNKMNSIKKYYVHENVLNGKLLNISAGLIYLLIFWLVYTNNKAPGIKNIPSECIKLCGSTPKVTWTNSSNTGHESYTPWLETKCHYLHTQKRGISLINTAYKVLSHLLLQRIASAIRGRHNQQRLKWTGHLHNAPDDRPIDEHNMRGKYRLVNYG